MTISVRLNDQDAMLVRKYAEVNSISVSDLVRQAVIEKIEDEYDLKAFNAAILEYEKDPVTFSLDEVEKDLSL